MTPVITRTCWLVSVAGIALAAALGSSAAIPPLPGERRWPPYSLGVHPPDGLVHAVLVIATVAGVIAVWRQLTALRREGPPTDARRLPWNGYLAAGVLTLLPPVGSADIKIYVAYGQEAARGINPYLAGPQSPGVPQDALTHAVEPPWQRTPSVYGPLFNRITWAIADISHGDGHVAVTVTRLLFTGAFILTGLVLHGLCTTAPERHRVAVLWSANPLMLFTLVAGAHVDVLAVSAVVCAIALVRRLPVAAGVLLGLAATLKLNAMVALPALLWAVRHRVVTAAWILVGACVVAVPWYATTPDAFRQLSRISRFVTPAAPWRVVSSVIQPALGHAATRTLIDALAGATALAIVVLLFRRGLPPARVGVERRAAAFTAAITIGWVLTTAYVLPWYDSLAWATLALAGASYLDRVLLVHTGMLVLAFQPGRDVPLSRGSDLVHGVLHSGLSPAVLAVLIVVTVWLAVHTPRRRDPAGATPAVAGPAGVQ